MWGHTPERDGHITETCLSQWWLAEFRVEAQPYCCMEQFMMAEKARLFGDKETLEKLGRQWRRKYSSPSYSRDGSRSSPSSMTETSSQKTGRGRLFGDKETLEKILEATVQGKIKALGREVKNFDQAEWDKCKHTIVLTGNDWRNYQYFRSGFRLGIRLILEALG